MRHGLCTVSATLRWLPPHPIYIVLCALVTFVYLRTHVRLEREPLTGDDERWRRALELSIVITSYTCSNTRHFGPSQRQRFERNQEKLAGPG